MSLARTLTATLVCLGVSLSTAVASTSATAPVSGQPLIVGREHGLGPLSVGLSSYPVGAARITGGEMPDLFVVAGKFSHPTGLMLLPWRGVQDDGIPIFGQPTLVPIEGEKLLIEDPLTMLEHGGDCFLVMLKSRTEVRVLRFDKQRMRFVAHNRIKVPQLPRMATAIGVVPAADGSWELILPIPDGERYRPKEPDWRDAKYVPFDGTGRWTGGYPYIGIYAVRVPQGLQGDRAEPVRRISGTDREILMRGGANTVLKSVAGSRDIVVGTWWGNLLFYRNTSENGITLSERCMLRDPDGQILRHPSCGNTPLAYPRADGKGHDLISGGEGGVNIYRATGGVDNDGVPTFAQPVPVLQHRAAVYAGSLPVPNIVDWDGDGLNDLVVGNSEGRILFFRNVGNVTTPSFAPGIALAAGGEEILIQPGARGSLQGPAEARWGYVSPTVVDWNEDGRLDIVGSSALAEHVVWLGQGQRAPARLRAEQTLFMDGLELHGTWRNKPAVGVLAGRMAYIALDDDDCLHLYWRLDDRNLADGGVLTLENGKPISVSFLSAGGTGRAKLVLTDWDGDGVADLLVGTPRHGSVPDPVRGLPQSLGLPGSAVLFLRNAGSEAKPVFERPAILTHDGAPLYFGQHECAPAVGTLGGEHCLLVGQEDGRLIYLSRSRLGLFRPPVE